MTYNDLIQTAKGGEKILLGGCGIIDGLKNRVKSAVYTIVRCDNGNIRLRPYRSQRLLNVAETHRNQNIEIISKKEYKSMPIY